MQGMNTQVFNSDLPETARQVKREQLNIFHDLPPAYQIAHPSQNTGSFARRQGVDVGDGNPGPLSNNPLNSPLSLYPNPTWDTQVGFNSLNLNPMTFHGNWGDSLPVIGRGFISQVSNLERPGKHLVMTNKQSVVDARLQRGIPRLRPSTLGKA